jgi:hypothetical protein
VGYRVYWGTSAGQYAQPPGGGTYVTGTTFTTPSLPSGYTYYFSVTAVDSAGVESGHSNEGSKQIP